MKRIVFIIPVLLILSLLSSCIKSSIESEEKRVSIYFSALQIGEELTVGDNVIQIKEFKFALSRFNLYAANDVILQSSGNVGAFLFAYTDQITDQRLILDVGLGFSDIENFNGFEIFFEPVSNNANIGDAEFFGNGENFSQVIRGTVNEVDFVFKSSFAFEKFYEISGVQLSDRDETLVITTFIDLEDVFVDSNGDFLDPTLEENKPLIMNNIEANLSTSFGTESVF